MFELKRLSEDAWREPYATDCLMSRLKRKAFVTMYSASIRKTRKRWSSCC